jgi:general secretion pathway protein D
MIAEVALNKEFQYGLQYWFQTHASNQTGFGTSFGGLSNVSTSTTQTTTSTILGQTAASGFPNIGALAGAGVALGWIANAQNFAVFLNLLSTKTNVTVLSTPTLLATDNKDATITVGGREPVPTGSYTGSDVGTTGVFSTIQYEETGVILNVTPHINAGGLVRLEVEQTIRRVDPTTATVGANNTAPRFTERNVKTTVLAQSGATVVIGGIIDSSQNTGKNGIPFLQDLPLLSPLFSTTSNSVQRTELLVAITPHVIDQRGSEAPKELLEKLKNLKRRVVQ